MHTYSASQESGFRPGAGMHPVRHASSDNIVWCLVSNISTSYIMHSFNSGFASLWMTMHSKNTHIHKGGGNVHIVVLGHLLVLTLVHLFSSLHLFPLLLHLCTCSLHCHIPAPVPSTATSLPPLIKSSPCSSTSYS